MQYQEGKLAVLRLPSQEELMLSMGTSSFKVFRKGPLGWLFPKTVFSVDLAAVGWDECIPLTRALLSVLLVTQSLDLLSHAQSINDAVQRYREDFAEKLMESIERVGEQETEGS